MTITTRARIALFLSIAVVLVAGIAGAGSVGATSPRSEGGRDRIAGICVAPAGPESVESGPPPFGEACDDTIEPPVVVDPEPCGDQPAGADPDTPVSSCPGDEEPRTADPGDDAEPVEPRPGMIRVAPIPFDHVDVDADDRTLTVFFWSGVEPCYVLDHVDVEESPTAITITLFQGSDPEVTNVACIDIALLKKVVVQVDEPVGARRIVDGTT
ncbi:MAG TPA: hypothetical protein VFZ75_10990 [Actinomycetota bacterium]|nr:hypothetical protein [Actinomycetota bacterium]